MSDIIKVEQVDLQENGIIRDIKGTIIGRLVTYEDLDSKNDQINVLVGGITDELRRCGGTVPILVKALKKYYELRCK